MADNLIDDYQEFTRSTAVYPGVGEGSKTAVAYCALGLVGEAGEVAEKIKKWIRDDKLDLEQVHKELGDVYWYLARLGDELMVDSSTVLLLNREKLIDRQNRDVIKGEGDER